MRIAHHQRWNLTPRAAIVQQQRLREHVIHRLPHPLPATPRVAGVDVSYDQGSDLLFAAVVVLQMPACNVIAQATAVDRARFPYVPGLLSFREAPPLLRCFRKLACVPDVVMVDGQGWAHPRRFGLACHLGWLLELPTLGCAKSILCGRYHQLATRRGATAPLVYDKESIGVALRTRAGVQPVYVSIGHRIDLDSAVDVALQCAPRFRIPEPTRRAHILVNQLRLAL